MPIAAAVFVGPADLRVRKGHGLLTCVGLRTGATLCLYDPVARVAGMAHITHSDLTERNPNRPGKYVASGLEALIEMMERTGAFRNRLVAAVIGGAEISVTNGEDNQDALVLDSGVCRALHLELHRNGVWIRAEDVGGKTDRSVKFDAANGAVRIRKGSSDNLLCELGAAPTKAVAA